MQSEFPNPGDRMAVEKFLFDELTLGEELMNTGINLLNKKLIKNFIFFRLS